MDSVEILLNQYIDWEEALCKAEQEATLYVVYLKANNIKIRGGIKISKKWKLKRAATNDQNTNIKKVKLNTETRSGATPDEHSIEENIVKTNSETTTNAIKRKMNKRNATPLGEHSNHENSASSETTTNAKKRKITNARKK